MGADSAAARPDEGGATAARIAADKKVASQLASAGAPKGPARSDVTDPAEEIAGTRAPEADAVVSKPTADAPASPDDPMDVDGDAPSAKKAPKPGKLKGSKGRSKMQAKRGGDSGDDEDADDSGADMDAEDNAPDPDDVEDAADPADGDQAAKLAETIEYAATHDPPVTAEEVEAHFRKCSAEYILTVTPLRLCQQLELYRCVTGTDGTSVRLEPESDPALCRIVVAVGNATRRGMLERIATRLAYSHINIHRAYLDVIDDGANGSISLLGFVVQSPDGGPIDPDCELWKTVHHDLLRNKWIEHRTLQLAYRNPELGVTRSEVVTALCDLAHQVLVRFRPVATRSARSCLCHLRHQRMAHLPPF